MIMVVMVIISIGICVDVCFVVAFGLGFQEFCLAFMTLGACGLMGLWVRVHAGFKGFKQ